VCDSHIFPVQAVAAEFLRAVAVVVRMPLLLYFLRVVAASPFSHAIAVLSVRHCHCFFWAWHCRRVRHAIAFSLCQLSLFAILGLAHWLLMCTIYRPVFFLWWG
jgi:hypothetical protein